jgi:microcystin-dependent protein
VDATDGTEKSVTLSCTWKFSHKGATYTPANGTSRTVSVTATLPAILRASTVSATDGEIGRTINIVISRKVAEYTHTLSYAFGNLTGDIPITANETVVPFTLPTSFYSQIIEAKSGVGAIYCKTYNTSGTQIGDTQSASFKALTTEEECKPTVSLSAVDTNTTTTALTGDTSKMVKYFSNAKVTLTATAQNSSYLKSTQISCGDGKSSTATSDTFNAVESATFVGSAVDSRDYSNKITLNQTLVNYIKLTCNVTAYRVEPTTGEVYLKVNGNYFNQSFGAVANTITLRYRYKESTSSTWSSWVTITATKSGNTYSYGAVLSGNFDYTKSFNYQLNAYDKLMSLTVDKTVSQGIPVFDWGEEDFNFNVPIDVKGITYKNLLYTPHTEKNKLSVTATRDDYFEPTGYYGYLETGKHYTFSCQSDASFGGANGTDTVEAFLLKDNKYDTTININTNPKTFTVSTSGYYYLRVDVNKNGQTHYFWDVQIEEGITKTNFYKSNPLTIVDVIYPIGSIYTSINDVSPSILFGGTWEQIKDTFLLSAGDTYTAGTTGGEASHTLTIEEMPEHNHNLMAKQDGGGGNSNYWRPSTSGTTVSWITKSGGSKAHNNMPPYLTVYMWKRTA